MNVTAGPNDPMTEHILKAAFYVHSALGPGLLEATYEACLEHTLVQRGHHVVRQAAAPLTFDGLTYMKLACCSTSTSSGSSMASRVASSIPNVADSLFSSFSFLPSL